MLKKRLIFTLLYQENSFWYSRNFRLQRVGDVNWLLQNYQFSRISSSIDELMILDVSRNSRNTHEFLDVVGKISSNCFLPLSLGGGISSAADAALLINKGADKIVMNTNLFNSPDLVDELVSIYGSQSIIASIDYKLIKDSPIIYTHNGSRISELSFADALVFAKKHKIGEILLNSIDLDGTGNGFCVDILSKVPQQYTFPIIMAGGAGNHLHIHQVFAYAEVDAVSTANLFNFIGDGLPKARSYLINNNVDLAKW